MVECLINERDKNLGAIDNRNREQEIAYQMQFADEWLQLYKNSRMLESNEDLIVNFKFSFEDSNVRLRLSKREIEQSYEKTLAPAISSIVEYKEKKCSNAIKYAILVGPAFEEENFRKSDFVRFLFMSRNAILSLIKISAVRKNSDQSKNKPLVGRQESNSPG